MSPILVRPVREQLEHDRIIRLLQAKYKRKFEVAINPGNEQNAGVGGPPPWFPDLVLQSGKRVAGVVEVETAESVNHLEAMSEWRAFSQLRTTFHLYVPASMIDVGRRLCEDMQISVGEIWAYTVIGDQPRFTLVQRTAVPEAKARPAVQTAVTPRAAAPARPGANGQAGTRAQPATRARAAAPVARRKTAAKKTARPAARRAAARKPAARSGRSAPKKGAARARAQKRK